MPVGVPSDRRPGLVSGPMMRTLAFSTVCAMLAIPGCGGDTELTTAAECNPLGGSSCVTPWPSSIYEVADPSTLTGYRLAIPTGALPTNIDGILTDPAPYNAKDGFSSAAPLVTAFATGVDPSNLVHYSHYADSVTDASPTVLIDMTTGELVVHFAELDAPARDTPGNQALFIRPAALLKGNTRYVVAIKRTLKAKGGGELPIPEGFGRWRTG